MYSRWVNMAVLLLWLSTMGWLVTSKVLPPLLVGEPPSFKTIVEAGQSELPVGWQLAMQDRPVGWALTTITAQPDGLTEIASHVHFDELPLAQLAPAWLRSLLRLVDQSSLRQPMDARSVLFLDPLGRLTRFESTIGMETADDLITLKGEIVGSQILLTVRSGDFLYRSEAHLPSGALLSDSLQPHTKLPGLRQGQVWTVPVYSPLRPPNSPLEILQAEVEGKDLLLWEERVEPVWLVVYKNDPGSSLLKRQETRGRLWVRRDGTVLRHEVGILGAKLTFSRLTDHEALSLKQLADTASIPKPRPEPTHVEHWPLHWPAFPFGTSEGSADSLLPPDSHDPLR